eukprot:3813254-Amphidinium_carterae.1
MVLVVGTAPSEMDPRKYDAAGKASPSGRLLSRTPLLASTIRNPPAFDSRAAAPLHSINKVNDQAFWFWRVFMK